MRILLILAMTFAFYTAAQAQDANVCHDDGAQCASAEEWTWGWHYGQCLTGQPYSEWWVPGGCAIWTADDQDDDPAPPDPVLDC